MKRYKHLLLAAIVIFTAAKALAQIPLPTHLCGTMYADSLRRALNPSLGSFNYSETDSTPAPAAIMMQTTGVITIPVVFHIIHYGEEVGVERNISQAQINSQITVMNEDFRRMSGTPGWNNNPVGADIEIEFCAAIVDPQGNYLPEPGIDRRDGHDFPGAGQPPYDVYYVEQYIKPGTIWDPNRYYNIWVVDIMDWGGYSQFPDSSGLPGLPDDGGEAQTDGFQVYYKYVGRYPDNPFVNDFNMGRIASHEMGHALGLRHAWGDTGGCAGTDYCEDTPTCDVPGNYYENYNCTSAYECNNYRMIENYMDYSLDPCRSTFTLEQKSRMRHVMNVCPRRRTLGSSNVCSAGPNCQRISYAPSDVSENTVVTYSAPYDGGYATTYQWYFPGGNPSSSTDANPVVTYTTYGVYDVTIIISNQFGTCSYTHEGYMTVLPDNPCDTLKFPFAGTENNYAVTGGFACGWNAAMDESKAEFFQSPAPYPAITGGILHVSEVNDNGNGAYILCRVWNNDGLNGAPGSVASEKKIMLSEIENIIPQGGYYEVLFSDPNAVEGDFYFGFTMVNFGTGDSLGIFSNTDGDATPVTAWEQHSAASGGNWQTFSEVRNLEISMQIFPYVTMHPAYAHINQPVYSCAGSDIHLSADTAGVVEYSWWIPDGNPSTSTSSSLTVVFNDPGEYKIYLSVVGQGCHTLDRDSAIIVVHGNPSVAFSTQEPACYGYNDGVVIVGILKHAQDSIDPDPSRPLEVEMQIFDHLLLPVSVYIGQNITFPWYNAVAGLGAGDYTIMAVNTYGCVSEVTFTLGQPDEISITTGTTPHTCAANPNGTASATVSGGTSPYTYSWSDANSQTTSTATGLTNGVYSVVVVDSNGCAAYQSAAVPLGLPFCVKTNALRVISPDGDGENDTWQIDGLQDRPDAMVKVYNAFGQEVFASVGYTTEWDGTMHGQPLPAGVYSYTISDATNFETGTVMLVR